MRKSIVAAFAVIFIAVALAVPAFAGSPLDTAKLQTTAIGGRAYTPQCLSECHLVLEIKPSASTDLTKSAADSFKKDYSNGAADKSGCVLESRYEIWAESTWKVQSWVPDVKCQNKSLGKDAKNGTDMFDTSCVDSGKYASVDEKFWSWLPIETFKPNASKSYYIDLVAKRKLTPECARIDAVPTIYGEKLSQFAWWDNSWLYKKPLTITAASGLPSGYTFNVSMDMSGPHFALANGDDVRLVLDTGTPIELDRNISSPNTAGAVLYGKLQSAVPAGTSNVSYWIYYGNALAGAAPNDKNRIYYSYDDFEGYANGTTPANWSYGAPSGSFTASNAHAAGGSISGYWSGLLNVAPSVYDVLYTAKAITPLNYSVSFKAYVTEIGDHIGIGTNAQVGNTQDTCAWSRGGDNADYCNQFPAWSGGTSYPNPSPWLGDYYNQWVSMGANVYDDGVKATYYWSATGSLVKWHDYDSNVNTGGSRYAGITGAFDVKPVYIDNFMVKLLSPANPSYALGSEESVGSTYATLIYGNTTNAWNFKNGNTFTTTIEAGNATPQSTLGGVRIEFNGANHTATNTAGNTWSWGSVLSGVPGGIYTIKQFAQNGTSNWETNTSNYFDITLLVGLNISAFNMGNGTALTAWGIYITNGTAGSDYSGTLSEPAFISQASLPLGPLSITIFKGGFQNYTTTSSFSGIEYSEITARLSRYQEFHAQDERSGGAITGFSLTAANSTASYSTSTGTATLLVPLSALPKGNTTLTISSAGWVPNATAATINGNNEINSSWALYPAGLGLWVRDESTGSAMVYNLTLSNSTSSVSYQNQSTGLFTMFWGNSSMPLGDATITISALGYGQRVYYANMNGNTFNNVSGWMLSNVLGSYVRFHTLTITDAGIPNVLVQATRQIGGSPALVGSMLTDATGTALFFLEPTATYQITTLSPLYANTSNSIMPSQSDYKIYLTPLSAEGTNISSQFSGIEWSFYPNIGTLTNSTSQLIEFNISSTNSSLLGYGMNITWNGTLLYSGTGTSPGGGNITAHLNLWNMSGQTLHATLWFNKTGYPLYVYTYDLVVWEGGGPNSLWNTLTGLNAQVCGFGGGVDVMGRLWCFPLAIISLLGAAFTGAAGASKFGLNGGGVAAIVGLWFFSAISWFPWQITMILTLVMAAVVLNRGGVA